jgi:hypothetical protein
LIAKLSLPAQDAQQLESDEMPAPKPKMPAPKPTLVQFFFCWDSAHKELEMSIPSATINRGNRRFMSSKLSGRGNREKEDDHRIDAAFVRPMATEAVALQADASYLRNCRAGASPAGANQLFRSATGIKAGGIASVLQSMLGWPHAARFLENSESRL